MADERIHEEMTEAEQKRYEELQRKADEPYPGTLGTVANRDDRDTWEELGIVSMFNSGVLIAVGIFLTAISTGYFMGLAGVAEYTALTWTQLLSLDAWNGTKTMATFGGIGLLFLGLGFGWQWRRQYADSEGQGDA